MNIQESAYIAIEAGGTKFVCAWGYAPTDLRDRVRIATKDPEQTMAQVVQYIKSIQQKVTIRAIGLGCFGPLDLNPQSDAYGTITSTPKKAWFFYNICGHLAQHFDLPIGFDTDVNAAAIAEGRWGAAQGLTDFLYITVGTGIGVGAIANGAVLHGAMHPEMGHVLLPRRDDDRAFKSVCSFHENCAEGLAAGPAIKDRWGVESAMELAEDHPAWDLEANYLAAALTNYTLILSPQRIVMGGGVMQQTHLLEKVRQKLQQSINGYVNHHYLQAIDNYVVAPGLQTNSGLAGAWALAERAVF